MHVLCVLPTALGGGGGDLLIRKLCFTVHGYSPIMLCKFLCYS